MRRSACVTRPSEVSDGSAVLGLATKCRRMKSVVREQAAVERETERILARMASGASLEREGEARVAAER